MNLLQKLFCSHRFVEPVFNGFGKVNVRCHQCKKSLPKGKYNFVVTPLRQLAKDLGDRAYDITAKDCSILREGQNY